MELKIGNKSYKTKTTADKPRLTFGNEFLELTPDKSKTTDGEKLFCDIGGTRHWVKEYSTHVLKSGMQYDNNYIFEPCHLGVKIGNSGRYSAGKITPSLHSSFYEIEEFCFKMSNSNKPSEFKIYLSDKFEGHKKKEFYFENRNITVYGLIFSQDGYYTGFVKSEDKLFLQEKFMDYTKEYCLEVGDFKDDNDYKYFEIYDFAISNQFGRSDVTVLTFKQKTRTGNYYGEVYRKAQLITSRKVSDSDFVFLTKDRGTDELNTIKMNLVEESGGLFTYETSEYCKEFGSNFLNEIFSIKGKQRFALDFEQEESKERSLVFTKNGLTEDENSILFPVFRSDFSPENYVDSDSVGQFNSEAVRAYIDSEFVTGGFFHLLVCTAYNIHYEYIELILPNGRYVNLAPFYDKNTENVFYIADNSNGDGDNEALWYTLAELNEGEKIELRF